MVLARTLCFGVHCRFPVSRFSIVPCRFKSVSNEINEITNVDETRKREQEAATNVLATMDEPEVEVYVRYDGDVWDRERITREVSRLRPYIHARMNHVNKVPQEMFDFQKTRSYKALQYAKYGRESGINPGLMWPSVEEVELMTKSEKDLAIPTLQESWKRIDDKKKAAKKAADDRDIQVDKNMAKMADEIKAFRAKQRKAEEAVQAERAKREKLMDEAKDLLGFKVDPRDKRFQEMLEQKELEDKKKLKAIKKKEKEAKAIARLTSAE